MLARAIAQSPYVGHKNSLVLIVKTPVSNNKVVLNFNSSCLKYSLFVVTGARKDKGNFTSNLSCFKVNANNKPAPTKQRQQLQQELIEDFDNNSLVLQ